LAVGKDIRAVDEKLLRVYGVTYHYTTRAKRRKSGEANVAYVRYKRRFILMAQPGEGEIWNGSVNILYYLYYIRTYFTQLTILLRI
jgi:hypothetical protein